MGSIDVFLKNYYFYITNGLRLLEAIDRTV